MTNEEAKDYIREWCPYDRQEEIIKALEQEPCEELYRLIVGSNSLMLLENYKTGERTVIEKRLEPCEDAISRQAVLSMQYRIDDSATLSTRDVVNVDDIEDLPSIQPKPKTDVLDKIRAEVEEVQTYKMFEGEDTVYVERKDVLAIIDKYMAESEK